MFSEVIQLAKGFIWFGVQYTIKAWTSCVTALSVISNWWGFTCQNHNIIMRHARVEDCRNFEHLAFFNMHWNCTAHRLIYFHWNVTIAAGIEAASLGSADLRRKHHTTVAARPFKCEHNTVESSQEHWETAYDQCQVVQPEPTRIHVVCDDTKHNAIVHGQIISHFAVRSLYSSDNFMKKRPSLTFTMKGTCNILGTFLKHLMAFPDRNNTVHVQ